MKKTKIIATLGPVTDSPEMMMEMIDEGVNVFRLNFSHGTHEEHRARIERIKKIREDLGVTIGILADLQGPKIRVGVVDMELIPKKEVVLSCANDEIEGEIPVQYKELYKDVQIGDPILLDDGLLELKVIEIKGKRIKTKVVVGGHLSSKKGINLPSSSVSAEVITEKDREDAKFALSHGVDFIALSFVRSAEDIKELRMIVKGSKNPDAKIIAKIERHEAVTNLSEIVKETDIVMVARGDLGVEILSQKVPIIQKKIVRKCLLHGRPVIVATQMLDSMIRNPRPTRAETSDVANAILDGADAIMLSGETSVGNYPLDAVKTMTRIALDTERWMVEEGFFIGKRIERDINDISHAVTHAASDLALITNSKYIIAASASGKTARSISKYRPHADIIAVAHNEKVARQLTINWGIFPTVFEYETHRELIQKVSNWLLELKLIKKGEYITALSGYTKGKIGGTNMIRVHKIGQ